MDIDAILSGDPAAVFGLNVKASQEQIEAAQRDAKVYGEAVDKLVERIGLRPGYYANEQAIFGPVVRMLALAGWTFSGSGFFSICFYKDGLALKLSLKGNGDSAIDYAEWAAENHGMPGVPTIYAIGRFQRTAAVLMERYEPINHKLDYESDDYCEFLACEFEDAQEALNTGYTDSSFPLAATALAIRERFKGVGDFDLHECNVMQDRDGNIIITDPLGRSYERSTRYGGYTYDNDDYEYASQAA